MPSLLQLGELRVCVYAGSLSASRLVEQFLTFWSTYRFPIFYCSDEEIQHRHRKIWYLGILSPHILSEQVYPTWLSEDERRICAKIHRTWATTSFFRRERMSNQPLWIKRRPYLYIDYGSPNHSFCLISGDANDQLVNSVLVIYLLLNSIHLATWWHVLRDGLCLHSVGVVKENRGFLFLGDSEAGKTTVAKLSIACGYPALGDDLNIIMCAGESGYRLAAVPSPMLSPVGYSMLRPPLKGVFTLVQDRRDYLEPMSHRQTAHALFESFMQTPSGGKLPDEAACLAFRTCCNIARRIPGYELHFRKTSDFWEIIDERFSD